MSYLAALHQFKNHEPVKRNHDGWRYHAHRFQIKNGISCMEAMRRELIDGMYKPNPLLKMLLEKKVK